jgi:hypothetical protein
MDEKKKDERKTQAEPTATKIEVAVLVKSKFGYIVENKGDFRLYEGSVPKGAKFIKLSPSEYSKLTKVESLEKAIAAVIPSARDIQLLLWKAGVFSGMSVEATDALIGGIAARSSIKKNKLMSLFKGDQ